MFQKLYFVSVIYLLAGIILLATGCSKEATTTTLPAGTSIAQSGDTVQVNYTLKLSNGSIYQTTVGGTPFQFTLGQNQVIPGFESAVTGMAIGQTKTVIIPAAQAYGTQKSATNPLAGQNLTFVITLLEIEPW